LRTQQYKKKNGHRDQSLSEIKQNQLRKNNKGNIFLSTVFGFIYISEHSIERYVERIGIRNNMSFKKSVEMDLSYKKIMRIINVGKDKHIFTIGKREFVFEKKGSNLVFKTAIRHNREGFKTRMKRLEEIKNS